MPLAAAASKIGTIDPMSSGDAADHTASRGMLAK
jgi:hypothetical protein